MKRACPKKSAASASLSSRARPIACSVTISSFVSLTLSPALCAILLKPEDAKPDWFTRMWNFLFGWFFRGFNWLFEKVIGGYTGTIRRLVRLGAVVMLFYVGMLALTYFGFNVVPVGFIPQ